MSSNWFVLVFACTAAGIGAVLHDYMPHLPSFIIAASIFSADMAAIWVSRNMK